MITSHYTLLSPLFLQHKISIVRSRPTDNIIVNYLLMLLNHLERLCIVASLENNCDLVLRKQGGLLLIDAFRFAQSCAKHMNGLGTSSNSQSQAGRSFRTGELSKHTSVVAV